MKIVELANGTQAQVAEYKEQEILEYQNNPLIEALPLIYSQQEVIDQLSVYPPYHREERYLEDHKRIHLLQRILRYYQPLPIHLQIQSSIDRLLRTGYVSRNPLTPTYAQEFVDNWNNIQNKSLKSFDNSVIQTGQTMSIIGISGVGKTRTLQRIFDKNIIPQVICHTSYRNQPLTQYQVTYLKIETPSGIHDLIERLPKNSTMDEKLLIDNHTMHSFYTAFLPKEKERAIYKSMLSDDGRAIYMQSGIMASSIAQNKHFKYCPA